MTVAAVGIGKKLAELIDIWCERRALEPLRIVLPHSVLVSGLTDEWAELASALKTVRVRHFASLQPDEWIGS
jgi:hypothetical protein